MFTKMKAGLFALAVSASLVTLPAFAQTTGGAPDVSDVVTAIGADATPIADIGKAVLLIVFGIAVWKWLRRTA